MKRFSLAAKLVLISMFLTAPLARGLSPNPMPRRPHDDSFAAWQRAMIQECEGVFQGRAAIWSELSGNDTLSLARMLCRQGGVIWPFVEARDNERYQEMEAHVESALTRANTQPLVLGVTSPSARLSTETIHAVRHALYPSSSAVYRWVDDPVSLSAWLKAGHAGRMGGVIYVVIEAADAQGVNLEIDRARRAIEFVKQSGMTGYTLIVDVRVDHERVMTQMPIADWLTVGTPRCQPSLVASL